VRVLFRLLAVIVGVGFLSFPGGLVQGQGAGTGYLGGVVQGENGPEAGVWVIAETKELPTQLIKIVVTDDQGRFMLPDLPTATYSVWVRGYGLVDSTPVMLKPNAAPTTLRATTAKTPQEAAKVYPGNYWLSLMQPPPLLPSRGPATPATGSVRRCSPRTTGSTR